VASESRDLTGAPGSLGLYARAAAPMVPGASLLPFVGGRGSEIPDLELRMQGVGVDVQDLARYTRTCGFRLADTLPSTYIHVLAFPLHMALMTDPSFPFPAVGLVHIENRIVQHRPVRVREPLSLRVRATPIQPHPKGRQFTLVSEAFVGSELVWEGFSTNLRFGGGGGEAGKPRSPTKAAPPVRATWKLDGGLGRRYGAASGDRNPIHMHDLSAKLFGFNRAIAHGMWTNARCLAALEGRLPSAYEVEVAFKKPILLPATVAFGSAPAAGDVIDFSVRSTKDAPHLDGTVRPTKGSPGQRKKP